jgi:hypothetical protein
MYKESDNLKEKTQVCRIISIACGSLNLIYSGFVIYFLVKRVLFLLANKEYVTVFDYIYIAIAALYLVVNMAGSIVTVIVCIKTFTKNDCMKLVFNGFLFFGIVVLGIIILFIIGVIISLGNTEFKDYLKFLLFNLLLIAGIGLVLSLGTFVPQFLLYNTSEEEMVMELPQVELKI